jgi:hypothetical protein
MIRCEGEESVSVYTQIFTVKHPQPLNEVNHNSDKSKSTKVHVRMICDCVCDAVDLFNSVFSVHMLVLVAFYSNYIYLCSLLWRC